MILSLGDFGRELVWLFYSLLNLQACPYKFWKVCLGLSIFHRSKWKITPNYVAFSKNPLLNPMWFWKYQHFYHSFFSNPRPTNQRVKLAVSSALKLKYSTRSLSYPLTLHTDAFYTTSNRNLLTKNLTTFLKIIAYPAFFIQFVLNAPK